MSRSGLSALSIFLLLCLVGTLVCGPLALLAALADARDADGWGCEPFFSVFGESGLLENEPTAPAEQAHTTRRQ